MSLSIRDANGIALPLKTTLSSGEHVTHHNIDTCALPTGAATAAKQDALLTELQLKAKLTDTQPVSGTVAISSSALPTGAAADSSLSTINSSLTTINATINSRTQPSSGQQIQPYVGGTLARGKTADITGTGDTQVIASPGVSSKLAVTNVIICNSHATVSTWVNLKFGSTAVYTAYVQAVGGQVNLHFFAPLLSAVNEVFNAACETTGSNVRVSATAFVI